MARFQESRFGRLALFIATSEPIIIWSSAGILYETHSGAPPWLNQTEYDDWDDGTGWMGSLMSLRSDLLCDDLRCLYLG